MVSKTRITSLSPKKLLALFENMITSRFMDEKMLIMLKQGKSFFHIGAAGHEAIQTAMSYAMKPGYDWVICEICGSMHFIIRKLIFKVLFTCFYYVLFCPVKRRLGYRLP